MLTQEEIEEFREIIYEDKGIDLTTEEAEDQGSRLIQIFELMPKHPKR